MELENISTPARVSSPRLPFLVLELLLEYLDFFTLQALRLVCKTTKSWVETREVLRHFVVRITGKGRLDEVLGAPDPVPWNSFIFTEKYAGIFKAEVQRFLAAYGDLVRELTFKWRESSEWPMLQLLSGCPHLESLKAIELHFDFISNELAMQLLENWKELRHFHVEKFNGRPNGEPAGPQPFFSRLLSSCTHLETLRVPWFVDERAPVCAHCDDYSHHKGGTYERLVLTPLLDTIGQGRLRSVEAPALFYDDEQFWRLALACRESGTVLRGIGFRHNLFPEHLLSLMDVLGDLDTITDTVICQPLTNVRSISLHGSMFRTFDNRAYTMPQFSYLISLNLNFDVRFSGEVHKEKSSEAMDRFAHRLATVKRPSVKKLVARYDTFLRNISPVALCSSFVNLRVLHVRNWVGEDGEWLKLWPLVGHTLVELDLFNCPNLSDRGILGDDLNQPAFLQLKHLRKLRYQSHYRRPEEKISELSFIHAFRHMRLRYFDFFEGKDWDNYKRVSTQTVKAMWDGPFGETIEHFVAQRKELYPRKNPQELGWMERIRMALMNIKRVSKNT